MNELEQERADQGEKTEKLALSRAKQALRLASASLPHLAGLARLARMKPSSRVQVAAVASSGLMLVNPGVFSRIPMADAAFVLGHELMHLALDTHGREGGAHPLLVNFAHDYIINDMLREELERDPPLDGLDMTGAREKSLEQLVVELSQGGTSDDMQCWSIGQAPQPTQRPRSALSRALEEAGLVETPPEPAPQRPDPELFRGDVLPSDREDEFEPELPPELRKRLQQEVRREAAKAASLAELKKKMDAAGAPSDQTEPQRGEAMMRALREAYQPPWELALQRWMDAVAPGERTYARPSRRSGDRTDVVLPGRYREGWTLHIVLDTSGSMVDVLPKALGAIAAFCEASGVGEAHVVQCDIEVTSDRWVEPQELAEFKIAGFGYSDMSPGLLHLADDPAVTAALVLTDGYISFPAEPLPYHVLWGLIGYSDPNFNPPYGQVIKMELGS